MCTVSISRSKNGAVLLTSNRDERVNRPTLPPDIIEWDGLKLLCPLDMEKGGTWIAAGSNGRIACLLNGGFEKHLPTGKESISRGKILLQSFQMEAIEDFVSHVELSMTEPFTMVLLDPISCDVVHELVWDGRKKHYGQKNVDEVNLWSSVTLYSESERARRREIYRTWKANFPFPTEKELIDLHTRSKFENGFLLEDPFLRTVSVTQITMSAEQVSMNYTDFLTNEKFNKKLKWERVMQ